jgi:hypothetical protein
MHLFGAFIIFCFSGLGILGTLGLGFMWSNQKRDKKRLIRGGERLSADVGVVIGQVLQVRLVSVDVILFCVPHQLSNLKISKKKKNFLIIHLITHALVKNRLPNSSVSGSWHPRLGFISFRTLTKTFQTRMFLPFFPAFY